MGYLILFGVIVAVAAALGAWAAQRWGPVLAGVMGALLLAAAVVLFFVNKSDSVADSALEHVADASPPLITFAVVIGWWLGVLARGGVARLRRRL